MNYSDFKKEYERNVGDNTWEKDYECYLGPNYETVLNWLNYYMIVQPDLPFYDNCEFPTLYNTSLRNFYYTDDLLDTLAEIGCSTEAQCIALELVVMHELIKENYQFPYNKLLEQL